MNETIIIPAVLAKAQFAEVAALKGCANDGAMKIGDGLSLAPGYVVFRGFRDGWANHADHLFYGNLYFEIYQEPMEAPCDDLACLSQFFADAHSRETQDQWHDEAPPADADHKAETIPDDDDGDQ